MRAVVILIIAGIAGLMAYLAYVGECPGGTVVLSREDCRTKLAATMCDQVYARANDVARNSGSVYTNPIECSRQFGPCLEHATIVGGWVPRPAGFCVNRIGIPGRGSALDLVPVYRADGGRSQQ